MNARSLRTPQLECPKDKRGGFELKEYIMGIDVARSHSQNNNKTAIVVVEIIRNAAGRVRQARVVNIITPPNGLTYEEQAIEVKRIFYKYGGNTDLNKSRVKAVVIDANTIGQGLVEKLLEDTTDPETNRELEAWGTINTNDKQFSHAPSILYCLIASGINGDIIRTFVDYAESKKLKLIMQWKDVENNIGKMGDLNELESMRNACSKTQEFIDEVANLKVKQTKSTNTDIKLERIVRRVDKDIYSALAYALYYINVFLDNNEEEEEELDLMQCFYMGRGTRSR